MKDYVQVQEQYVWLPESLMYGKLAQDSEDWPASYVPASYVATYPSMSLMCVRGYHVVFSCLVTRRRPGTPINMKGYGTL